MKNDAWSCSLRLFRLRRKPSTTRPTAIGGPVGGRMCGSHMFGVVAPSDADGNHPGSLTREF